MLKIGKMESEGIIFGTQSLINQHEKNRMIIYGEKIKKEENNYEREEFYRRTENFISEKKISTYSIEEHPKSAEGSSLDISFGESLVEEDDDRSTCASDQMKQYAKNINKMKKLGLQKCFSSSYCLFNLIPANPSHKIDNCPYIFHMETTFPNIQPKNMKKKESDDAQAQS